MEGLIPYVYRAIVQMRSGDQRSAFATSSWHNESPSSSYVRLPGDPIGGFRSQDIHLFSPPPPPTVPVACQTPACRFDSRRVVA